LLRVHREAFQSATKAPFFLSLSGILLRLNASSLDIVMRVRERGRMEGEITQREKVLQPGIG